MDDHLAKSFVMDRFAAILTRWLPLPGTQPHVSQGEGFSGLGGLLLSGPAPGDKKL